MLTCEKCKKEFKNSAEYHRHLAKWCGEDLHQLFGLRATAQAWQERARKLLGDQVHHQVSPTHMIMDTTAFLSDICDTDLGGE